MMRKLSIFCCCTFIILFGFSLSVRAGQWRETFEQEDLLNWSLLSEKIPKVWMSEWETGGGVLDVTIKNVKGFQIADFLQWTGCPLDAQNLTVVVHSMDTFGMPEGELGVFLGEKLAEGQDDFASGHFFSKMYVYPIQFSENGDRKRGDTKADFFRRFQLEILFRAGHFRLFSEDVLLTEFEDLELMRINVVGLLALTNGVADELHGQVETFTISGAQIPNYDSAVQPKGKVATMWSMLKSF